MSLIVKNYGKSEDPKIRYYQGKIGLQKIFIETIENDPKRTNQSTQRC